jgi:sulfide:quinone oxidoreductase
MAHVVVLGGGIGGISAAYEIKNELRKGDTLTVISANPYFQFTPSNPWVAVGWRTKADICLDLDELLKKRKINFIPKAAKKVHPEQSIIELDSGENVQYDILVIATGPSLAFHEVKGLGPENGHTHSVCTVEHALHAHKDWEEFCKNPGPIVVGAAQMASCYGPAYEFAAIMDTDLKRRKIRHKVPMTFVTAEPYIGHLGLGGVGDTKGMLEAKFRDRNIKWITNAKIDEVQPDKMMVTELNDDGSLKKQHELPFKFSMILPAFKGVEAVSGLEGISNPRGFTIVDAKQRNPKYKNIYAVGVCIAIAPLEATPVPTGVPKTGYMIESMVTAVAHNIGNQLRGKEPEEEGTWNAVCLADLGDEGVVFVARPQNPPRNVNWSADGKWVHYAKIAFEKYFIRKMKKGTTEPFYEKAIMNMIKVRKLKDKITHPLG